MTQYRKFRQFLRDNNCERQFDDAFYSQCGCNRFDETLADVMGIDESFFAHVFQWHRTPEGRAFWLNISDRWLERFPKIDGCPEETAQAGR